MKRIGVAFVVLAATFGIIGAQTFTDVNSASYWGKTDIPKLTSALDGNFAQIESGTVAGVFAGLQCDSLTVLSNVWTKALTASKVVFTGSDTNLTSSGTVSVGQGGTGATTLTDGGILLGSGTGAITALGVASNGQIPIGDGTTDPVLATITGTANEIDVSNGAGSITIGLVDPLLVAKGGTGAATLTAYGILYGNATGTGTVQCATAGTANQIMFGNTGAAPAFRALASGDIPASVVSTTNIIDGTIVDADINASAAIALSKLGTGALGSGVVVSGTNVLDGSIAAADLGVDCVDNEELADNCITTTNIIDGTIVDADIDASAAISLSKLGTGALGASVVVSGTNVLDGTITYADVVSGVYLTGTKSWIDKNDVTNSVVVTNGLIMSWTQAGP